MENATPKIGRVVEPVDTDTRGIVHPWAGLRKFSLDRFPPSPAVARFVDRYWLVRWNLPEGETYDQHVLVHPVVNVVFDPVGGVATVTGVQRNRFTRVLAGRGGALGVMFRPAGFRPLLGRPMSTITGTVLPLADVRPELLAAAPYGEPDERTVRKLDELLAELVPAGRQPSELTTEWAERAATDDELRRVDDLADAVGVGVRALQRAFNDHVGIGPKFVLRRYRLYQAAERAARDEHVDWHTLAADLGYADQAHLTREFTAALGTSPARYAASRPQP